MKMNKWDNAKERNTRLKGKTWKMRAYFARTVASQSDGTIYNYCVITNDKRDNDYDVDNCDDDHNDDDDDDDEDDYFASSRQKSQRSS